jgi:adenosylcobinamide kinase/adenosylcobinamide-phosphate guanylyltransferase
MKAGGKVALITGGARSGKSGFAEALARQRDRPVVYVATAAAGDDEMAARITRHRAQRPADWITLEIPLDLKQGLATLDAEAGIVLIDCLAFWAANRLLALGESEQPGWWAAVEDLERALAIEMGEIVMGARETGCDLILVTNEVGLGLVPPSPLGRAFRDLLGRLNQEVARQADAVFLVTAGHAIELKRLAKPAEMWERGVWDDG